jgi:hypothetical protein
LVPAKPSRRTTFGTAFQKVTRWEVFCYLKTLQSRPARFKQVYSDRAFSIVKLAVRFHKGLASYAYERLAKNRLDEERDCQR